MKRFRDLPWHRVILALIVVTAISLRSEGLFRPLTMHPDESPILEFMENTIEQGWLKGTTYPGGFFVMAEGARRISEHVWFRPWQQLLFHLGAVDRPELQLPPLEFGRVFIICLSALTVLLIYLLCRQVSGSRAAALFGATCFAFAAYPIEHSHYLESDIAMVAMLALSLWLWARYADKPHWSGFAGAALATGYAVGTKTTLVFLVPAVVIFALRRNPDAPPGPRQRRSGPLALRMLAGLVLVALGFVWSTREALNFSHYLDALRRTGAGAYSETIGILGPAHAEPWARQIYLLRLLWHFLGSVGAGWLLLAAAGLPLLFTRERRRFWPVTLLFPALYLYYFIFKAPWARSQEFMNFLPSFAVAAAVAAARLLNLAGRSRWKHAGPAVVALVLLALLVPTAQLGVAASSRCGWTDTRNFARSWLMRHLPYDTTITGEFYTSPSTYQVARSEVEVLDKVETQGLPLLLENRVDYLVRNASTKNRGQIDPRTGLDYPDSQAKLDAFRQGAEFLRAWSVIEPEKPSLSFRSPLVELWRLRPASVGPSFDVSLPQPMYAEETSRRTFFPVGSKLGAAEGVLIDRYGREFAVAGPEAATKPVFIIISTQGLAVRVHVKGFGRSRTAELPPFDVAVIPLQRPWWSPRFGSYERVRAWTEPQAHVVYLPCWVRVAFDATEAARLLAELGRPDRAWELLQSHGGGSGSDPGLAFRIAVESGNTAAASGLEAAAKAQLRQVDSILRGETAAWRLNGLSAEIHDQFARLRPAVRDVATKLFLLPSADNGGGATDSTIGALQSVPLRLSGPCAVSMEVRARGEAAGKVGRRPDADDGVVELRDAAGRLLYSGAWSGLAGADFQPLKFSLTGSPRERPITMRWSSPRSGSLEIRNVEVEWKLADLLAARTRELRIAQARWSLSRGATTEALAARAAIPEPGPLDFDVDLRRLDLELARAEGFGERIGSAARRLLERAPAHYGALRALAGVDAPSAAAAAALAGEDTSVVFGRAAAVRRSEIAGGRLRLVIEALSDDLPALTVEWREKKFNRWARRDRVPLSPRRALHAGERVVVELPTGRAELSRVGVSILSDNPHIQGELPARDGLTVRVADLLRQKN